MISLFAALSALVLTFQVTEVMGSCRADVASTVAGTHERVYLAEKATGPTVLLLPPTGGINITDRSLAAQLCDRGLTTIVFDYGTEVAKAEDLSSHDAVTKIVLNRLNERLAQVNGPVVMIGSSLGGLYSAVAFGASYHPELSKIYPELVKIQGMVLVTAGAPLADVLADSNLESLVTMKNKRLALFPEINDSTYRERLRDAIQLDPGLSAEPTRSSQVLMFIGTKDEIVLTRHQERLWELLGRPKVYRLKEGHASAIARTNLFWAKEMAEFVKSMPTRR